MPKLRAYHWTLITQHIVIIAAVIFFCIGSFFLGTQIIHTLQGIDTATADIHSTFEVINRPRTGTLAGLNQVIFGADALMKHTNKILDHEEKQLSTLDKQEASLFTDIHTFMNSATDTIGNVNTAAKQLNTDLETTNTTIQTTNTAVGKLPGLLDQLNTLTGSLDKKVNDPDIKKSISALAETSVQLQGTTTDVRKISDHFEQQIDNPKKGIVGKLKATWQVVWQLLMLTAK